jgi:hypothetical protein
MKRALEITLLVFGIICFICICSEPAEGTSMKTWAKWETFWWLAFIADAAICWLLDSKNVINLHGNGRA